MLLSFFDDYVYAKTLRDSLNSFQNIDDQRIMTESILGHNQRNRYFPGNGLLQKQKNTAINHFQGKKDINTLIFWQKPKNPILGGISAHFPQNKNFSEKTDFVSF